MPSILVHRQNASITRGEHCLGELNKNCPTLRGEGHPPLRERGHTGRAEPPLGRANQKVSNLPFAVKGRFDPLWNALVKFDPLYKRTARLEGPELLTRCPEGSWASRPSRPPASSWPEPAYFAARSPFFRYGRPSVHHFGAGAPLRKWSKNSKNRMVRSFRLASPRRPWPSSGYARRTAGLL
jgi:hypothetical protein